MNVIFKIINKLFFTLVNKFKYKFDIPFDIEYINFPITYLCNARCNMCDIWKINSENPSLLKSELSSNEIIDFFEKNKYALRKLKNIGITGGEPTMKKGLLDVFKYLKSNYPNTSLGIQTNGLFPDKQLKIIKEIYDINPKIGLAISLDGMEKTHEKVRGIKDAYSKAIETIKGAQSFGISEITCGLTITKENIEEIMEVAKVCKDLNVEFSCFLAEEGDYFDNENNENTKFTEEEKAKIAKILENYSYHYYMDNTRLQLLGRRKREINCYSGQSSFVLDPYGNIKPCLILPEVFGNIKHNTLVEIFNDPIVKEKQKELKNCKKCFLQCEVGTSLLMDFSDLLKWFLFYSKNILDFLNVYGKKYNKEHYKGI